MSDRNALRELPRSGWTATVTCVLALCGVPVWVFGGMLSISFHPSMDTKRPICVAAAVICGLSAAMLLLGALFLSGRRRAGRALILVGCGLVVVLIILAALQLDAFNGGNRIRKITLLLPFLAFPFATSMFALAKGTSRWLADENRTRTAG